MDDTELLERTFENMKQIDSFFNSSGYQTLINTAIISSPSGNKKMAEFILSQIELADASIEFFTDKKEWSRCYDESVKLVTILRDCVDAKYKPL